MCVILVCPENVRPRAEVLDACHDANPHGAGVAWRDGREVRWFKGLDPDEVADLIAKLPGEIVIHFRWASVGEVVPQLCHPFPVTACATTRLSGFARAVLFHNGTWGAWRDTLRRMPKNRTPTGILSDTRVAATLVDLCGTEVLDRLPGRWVFFERGFTQICGQWDEFEGMQVSNLNFLHSLRRQDSWQQPFLPFSGTCGTQDS
jgi:hypothetical protein